VLDYNPTPTIPEELQTELIDPNKTTARVLFEIAPDGSFQVTLLRSSGNKLLDESLLKTLKSWRWKPALKNGVPVPFKQIYVVPFAVE